VIRVLVADDSKTLRELITLLLQDDPGIQVVGHAADGEEAVEQARVLRPDVITMDVCMPKLSGLDATTAIMEQAPSRIVVVCAVTDERAVALSLAAVARGALELVAKPRREGESEVMAWGSQLREAVRLMSEVPVVRRRSTSLEPRGPWPSARRIEALGVGASTGGPPALATLLEALSPALPFPVLVAQHLAPGFAEGLRRWLSTSTRLRVILPVDGTPARPGQVYLAPDERDLVLDPGGIVRVLPSRSHHRPSATRLFESLAAGLGGGAAAVVLSGMGDDGAAGVRAIVHAGGLAFAQDEASSVVPGMPRAAQAEGAVSLPLGELAAQICALHPSSKAAG
jgi:two-component system chemotaxis response regulator CheB